jgi:hypothetical protein
MPSDQPSLALDWWLRLEARSRQGEGQPPGCLILVKVAGLELDDMHLRLLPDTFQVTASKYRPLAQVRAEVVDEHPTVDVASLGGSAVQSNRFHYLRG